MSASGSAIGENFDVQKDHRIETAQDESKDPAMQHRWNTLLSAWQQYKGVMEKTGFASTKEVLETEQWIKGTKLTDKRDIVESIVHREEFFTGHGKKIIEEGLSLHDEFYQKLATATPYISGASRERWIARFKDGAASIGFQKKKYWIQHQFPYYIEGWKKVMEDREKIMADPQFTLLNHSQLGIAKILDKNAFLNLHFETRKGLIAKAKAALLAQEKGQGDLYLKAKSKLNKLVTAKVLNASKVGVWLHRIFKSGNSRQKIEAFLEGTDALSLSTLAGKWSKVQSRYDAIADKVKWRGQNVARGLNIVSTERFRDMHYAQRLRYVEELEHRLTDANDMRSDKPASLHFIKIRHALDVKDWEEADELIQHGETMTLSDEEKERLKSMKRYLTHMRSDKKVSGSKNKASSPQEVAKARQAITNTLPLIPSSLQPMIRGLLKSPNPNRSINQFRWIVYNNKWCRDHNYLTRKRMMHGASKQNEENTNIRSKYGMDTGRDDVLTTKNLGEKYIRKDKYANHKATYRHVDLSSGGVTHTLGQWLQKEQNPKVLYWTTFCGNDGGFPMSENWHDDLLFNLTTLRAATKTLERAGFAYGG